MIGSNKSTKRMRLFGHFIAGRVYEIENNPTFRPGEKTCQWCKAKGECRAHAEYNMQLITQGFDDISENKPLPEPDYLTPEQLGEIAARADGFTKWIQAVEARATKLLEEGGAVPGMKLVEGRSIRKWVDPDRVANILRDFWEEDEIYIPQPPKMVTPAKVEKLIGKTEFASDYVDLIHKPQGKKVLARVSDPRPALTSVGFDDLDKQESS